MNLAYFIDDFLRDFICHGCRDEPGQDTVAANAKSKRFSQKHFHKTQPAITKTEADHRPKAKHKIDTIQRQPHS